MAKPQTNPSDKNSTKNHAMTSPLTKIMADTFTLAVKTHAAHWNVTGPSFFSMHAAFETQYTELYEAADELAERLRALGLQAPAGINEIAKASNLPGLPSSSDGVVLAGALASDHRALGKVCRETVEAAQEAGDEPTADLLIKRAEVHEKTAWMLGAAAT